MPDFYASVASFLSFGTEWEKVSERRNSRTMFTISIPKHVIKIRQRPELAKASANKYRGKFVYTSDVTITKVEGFQQGEQLVADLSSLLSIVSQSHVVPFAYRFGKSEKFISTNGFIGQFTTPFGPEADRKADFIEQVWPTYVSLREPRALNALIRLIVQCDYPNMPIEVKVAQAMICLENIKTYWALDAGPSQGIKESSNGYFVYTRSKDRVHFQKLIELTLADVGMKIPMTFPKIKNLRNAIIHRGLIRPQDTITTKIFGSVSSHQEMVRLMNRTYKDVQDILREYLFRLLGFRGVFHNYSTPYGRGAWTSI